MESINQHLPGMVSLVEQWVNINSHSENLEGIVTLIGEVQKAFRVLHPDEMRIVEFAKSRGLFLKKRAEAPIQIYFGGHLDTVYPLDCPFQKGVYLDKNILKGPGVTDMKGGIVVMLKALEIFEKKPHANTIGWEIFLNGDEEIGSPESTPFIEACAQRCQMACIFEPALDDGSLVSKRKGSSNYSIYSRGKKAHAGRNPQEGKNAIYPLAHFISQIESMNAPSHGTLINVGVIKGGEAKNVIPDYAECYLNIRADRLETMHSVENHLEQLAQKYDLQLVRTSFRPPKPLDLKTESLFQALKTCGSKLGIQIGWRESGGVCDGNTFAAFGVPTIDTLGVRGGKIHTEHEYLDVSSLTERIELSLLFLSEIALGKIKL